MTYPNVPPRSAAAPILLALLTTFAISTARAQAPRRFTDVERARLEAGELLRRETPHSSSAPSTFGGVSFIRVRVPIERVWRAVRNIDLFPRLIPSLERATVIGSEPTSDGRTVTVVRFFHRAALATSLYHVRMQFDDAARTISFALDPTRPRDVAGGSGYMTLSAYGDGTLVSWGMTADAGNGAVAQLFGPFLNDWLLKPPLCLRDELEPGRVNEC
ncbi:MAG: SRPBCC family protein [Sandaracinaceae bacterium]